MNRASDILHRFRRASFFVAVALLSASASHAELVLSQLVVELRQSSKTRADIEVWNSSDERSYVAVEPSEILNPGRANEQRRSEADPERRGLLVSPTRMILEPGQRKLVRLAALGPAADAERVYRVTIRPVAGELSSEDSGLKLLVGYDVLVLLRPQSSQPRLSAARSGRRLTLRNDGNASLELIGGRQCDESRKACIDLPGKRLYAGAEWTQQLRSDDPVEFTVVSDGRSSQKSF